MQAATTASVPRAMTDKPFARKFTDRQRAALVYAQLDAEQPVDGKRAAELAARGELLGPYADCGPFIATARYAQELAKKERDHREGQGRSALSQGPPKQAARAILAAAFDVIADDLAWLKTQKKGTRAAGMSAVLKATREALEVEAKLTAEGASRKPTEAEKPARETEAQKMAKRLREQMSNAHTDKAAAETQPPTHQGSAVQPQESSIPLSAIGRQALSASASPVNERAHRVLPPG